MSRYADIIARLEAVGGPSRELDRAIADLLDVLPRGRHGYADEEVEVCDRFTASLDAAIALVERMLPGICLGISSFPESELFNPAGWQAFVSKDPEVYAHGESLTGSIALLIAMFRALQAQEAGQ